MRTHTTLSLLLLASAAGALKAEAQRINQGFTAYEPRLPWERAASNEPLAARALPGSASSRARDYRWEALAIGAAAIGVVGAVAGNGLCHVSDDPQKHCLGPTLLGGLLGAVVGGVTGGLIGGLISKSPPDSER